MSKSASEPSNAASTVTPTSSSTSLGPNEIKAEIEADVAVVSNLKELEASFSRTCWYKSNVFWSIASVTCLMLCYFLVLLLVLKNFIGCGNFDKLIWQLQRDHIECLQHFHSPKTLVLFQQS